MTSKTRGQVDTDCHPPDTLATFTWTHFETFARFWAQRDVEDREVECSSKKFDEFQPSILVKYENGFERFRLTISRGDETKL